MYIQEITIHFREEKTTAVIGCFYSYLGTLVQSGQVYKSFPLIEKATGVSVLVLTGEKESLSDNYSSSYGKRNKITLEAVANSSIKVFLIGSSAEYEDRTCSCQSSESYILFTTYIKEGSPLHCGNCFGQIPLYRLDDKRSYGEIFCWESNYKACDGLQMRCHTGERFGTRQLSDYKSSLTKEGLDACAYITKLTGTPTYYYLYNYRKISLTKDQNRKCPSCAGNWLLEKQLHGRFDFKCDECGLLSNLSFRY